MVHTWRLLRNSRDFPIYIYIFFPLQSCLQISCFFFGSVIKYLPKTSSNSRGTAWQNSPTGHACITMTGCGQNFRGALSPSLQLPCVPPIKADPYANFNHHTFTVFILTFIWIRSHPVDGLGHNFYSKFSQLVAHNPRLPHPHFGRMFP